MHAEPKVEAAPADRPIFGLPVDTRILFSNHKGVYKPGIEKNKTKLLQKLAFWPTSWTPTRTSSSSRPACSPYSTLEQLTMGALWVTVLKRSLFVFTNKRLLHIPTTWKFDYRASMAQILYQDCRRLQVKGSGLVAEYHTGKKDRFACIPRSDRAIIKHFRFSTSASDLRSENPQRQHLCPNCTEVLPARAVTCPACGLEFKSRAKALTRSVLVPGGGYFYTGHPFLGAGDALGEAYLVILTLVVLLAGLAGDAEAMATFPFVLMVLVLEKLLTVYHSNSFLAEFIPENLKAMRSSRPVQRVQPEQPPIPAPPKPSASRADPVRPLTACDRPYGFTARCRRGHRRSGRRRRSRVRGPRHSRGSDTGGTGEARLSILASENVIHVQGPVRAVPDHADRCHAPIDNRRWDTRGVAALGARPPVVTGWS